MADQGEKMYRVYAIVQRPKQDDYWLNIGLAFPHQDGKGFNVMLQALPLNAKLVLREPSEEDKEPARQQRDERQDRGDRQPRGGTAGDDLRRKNGTAGQF